MAADVVDVHEVAVKELDDHIEMLVLWDLPICSAAMDCVAVGKGASTRSDGIGKTDGLDKTG